MMCPICKNSDPENVMIEHSRLHDDEFKYFYCIFSCDSFTMTADAYKQMINKRFKHEEQKDLINIALSRVISIEDLETVEASP